MNQNQYEDLLIDALLDRGFSVEEAERLVELQERVERERRDEEERRDFARWMARLMAE
jgi:DNA-binding transcriptional MerR regulator